MLFEGVTRMSETALKDISLQARGQFSGVLSACLAFGKCRAAHTPSLCLIPVQKGTSWFSEGSKTFSFPWVSSEVG